LALNRFATELAFLAETTQYAHKKIRDVLGTLFLDEDEE